MKGLLNKNKARKLDTVEAVNYLLLPFSGLFLLLSYSRKWLFRSGLLAVKRFNKPVIVVGNITVGGSGKTPIVIALSKHFKQQGKKVGVVSRGYGGQHRKGSLPVDKHTPVGISGDEALLIAMDADVPVMVNKNRAQAVKDLLEQSKVDLVISDDGLQHYRMGRKVEIVVIDGVRRFGNGFFLPAGPLREPKSRLKSVDFVINNGRLHPAEVFCELLPIVFVNLKTGVEKPLDYFRGKSCHGVAGIGNPQRFFDSLNKLGVVFQPHPFADHYAFSADDLAFPDQRPIIMTAKDCVKCSHFADERMWYLQVEANLDVDFLTQLDAKL